MSIGRRLVIGRCHRGGPDEPARAFPVEEQMTETTRGEVTIKHVALAAGVSQSTASRVLSGAGSTSTWAGQRVRSAAERLGYVPNPLAQALARGLGTRIVVAVSGSARALNEDPYLGRVISAMAEMCTREGVGVSLQWLPLGTAAPLDRLAADRSVRGVVLLNTTEQLLASVPRALYGRVASIGIGSPQVPSFDVDNGGGAAAVVRHLHVIGRRRIAMVTGPAWLPCTQRPVDAYQAVMAEAGLPVRIVPGDFTAERGHAGALEAMRQWPDTDAIFAICDATALGVLAALRGLGVQVPGDVAVAGFDDIPFAALSSPALTTATHPVERIAADAAAGVLDSAPMFDVEYPSRLVLRESA
jgi:DNA-binding LacI/PurR family transcriptional regulator